MHHSRLVLLLLSLLPGGMLTAPIFADGVCEAPEPGLAREVWAASTVSARRGDLVWDGESYGRVWKDLRTGDNEIFLQNFDFRGDPIGYQPVPGNMSDDPNQASRAAVAKARVNYGVVWRDDRDGNPEIYFRAGRGAFAINPSVRISETALLSTNPSIASDGTDFAIVWGDHPDGAQEREIRFLTVDDRGRAVSTEVSVTPGSVSADVPHLIWNGAHYGLTWRDARDGNGEIYFATVDTVGTVLSGPQRVSVDAAASETPRLAWNGSGWAIAWSDPRHGGDAEIYFRTLDPTGNPTSLELRITEAEGASTVPQLAWTGDEYGLAWVDERDGNQEIYFARLSPAGSVRGALVRLTESIAPSEFPRLAWTGAEFGVSWTEDDQIVFQRIGCDCTTDADGDGTSVCNDCDDLDPAVRPGAVEVCNFIDDDCNVLIDDAPDCPTNCESLDFTEHGRPIPGNPIWTGSEFASVWVDQASSTGRFGRFDRAGTLLALPAVIPAPDAEASLVWTGAEFAYFTDYLPFNAPDLIRLAPGGAVISGPTPIFDDPTEGVGRPRAFRVVWDGSAYSVWWNLGVEEPEPPRHLVYFRQLDATGVPTGPSMQVFQTPEGEFPGLLWVTRGHGEYFVVAESYEKFGQRWLIHARVGFDGLLRDVINRAAGGYEPGTWPVVTSDGYAVLDSVVLADQRGCVAFALLDFERDAIDFGYPSSCSFGIGTRARGAVWNGSEYALLWSDGTEDVGTLWLSRVDVLGRLIAEVPLPRLRFANGLFWTGSEYAVVHSEGVVTVGCDCDDDDEDGVTICAADCDDADPTVFPGAPQLCDGRNNDCDDPSWPDPPPVEQDADDDGFAPCAGDCDDANDAVYPGAFELCNAIDDDCDALIDEDADGEDSDGDAIHNACDNCTLIYNLGQTDRDGDLEGDACDVDDGLIYLLFEEPSGVDWDDEVTFDAWNVYRGDLDELVSSGVYTQAPGSNTTAAQVCLLDTSSFEDPFVPAAGNIAFYLTTGVGLDGESDLGNDSSGMVRPNIRPCPLESS